MADTLLELAEDLVRMAKDGDLVGVAIITLHKNGQGGNSWGLHGGTQQALIMALANAAERIVEYDVENGSLN